MRTEELGGLRVRITGGDDREGGGQGPVVVLLHGFGAPGEDLVPLWRVLDVPKGTRFVFPEGPLDLGGMYGMSARAWWLIDIAALDRAMREGKFRDFGDQIPEGMPEARQQVMSMLDAIDTTMKPSKLVIGGFSQGAMLALDAALHTERPLDGLVLLSGTLLAEKIWVPKLGARREVPVFQSHGSSDPILPFDLAERLRDRLREAEIDVEWVPFRGGHEIPPPVLAKLSTFLAKRLGGEPA